jgi:hypothetical protein
VPLVCHECTESNAVNVSHQYNKSISGTDRVRCSDIMCLSSGQLYNTTTCKLEMMLQAFTGDNTVPFETRFNFHSCTPYSVILLVLFHVKNVCPNDMNGTCILGT